MTDWYGAGAMLLAGIIIGVLVLYRMKQRADVPDSETLALEKRRDDLVRQLRELHDAGAPEEDRRKLERETADVLRAIDTRATERAEIAAARTTAPATLIRQATMKGFLWGAGSVALLGGLGWYVSQKAQPRSEGQQAPMGAARTGTMQPASPRSDPALQELEAAVAKDPNNLPARDELARAYLDRENLMAVFDQTKFVLERAPDDARALTYQALVRIAMGQVDNAEGMLTHAIKSDPKILDAYVGLAWAQMTSGKTALAEQTIQAAAKQHPEEQPRLQEVLAKMKQQAAAQPPSSRQHPADGVDRSAPSMMQMPAGSNTPMEAPTHVTVQLEAGRAMPPTGVLFVIARSAGVTSGPPAAVKRLPLSAFPLEVDLTSADSMMGQPLPPAMRLEARIDSDGNPLTKDPKDPVAVLDNVAMGSKVQLTLH